MKSLKFILVLSLCFSILLAGCVNESNNKEEIEVLVDMGDEIPEAIVLTKDDIEIGKKLNETTEAKVVNNEDVLVETQTIAEENIDPYKAYDEYMANAQGISIEEAENERQIDLFKIIMCSTNNAMPITEFDDYTLIAMLYYVHVDGKILDIYNNCFTEEEVKQFLINNDGLGLMKFSTILNDHKFTR